MIVPAIFDDGVSSFAVAVRPAHAAAPNDAARSPAARAAESAAGRLCAHASLRAAGARGAIELRSAPSGAPAWPRGFVGSIAHSSSIAWAVAAPTSRARSVGIDVEELAEGEALRAACKIAIGAHERAIVGPSPVAITAAFCAKESLLKCLAPIAAERFDFADACLAALERNRFRLVLLRALGALPRGLALEGRYAVAFGHVFAGVTLDA